MADEIAELYRRFGPAIHRRARSLLKNDQEAMDVTQETFLAYLQQQSEFRGGASVFTFLYQIATFRAFDRLRKNARWFGAAPSIEMPEESESPLGQAPWVGSGEDLGLRRVEAASDLALLTKGEKPDVLTAALLYYVEGYTTEEVAQSLDLSRKTVGKLLAQFAERAKKRRARYEEEKAA
jgi:RNA polymerase sigma-70 factor (ECF subfamily)